MKKGKYEKCIWTPTDDKPLEKWSEEQLKAERKRVWQEAYKIKCKYAAYNRKIADIDRLLKSYEYDSDLKAKLKTEAEMEMI